MSVSVESLDEISRLQEIKARSDEKCRIPFPATLSGFFTLEEDNLLHEISGFSTGQVSWKPLDTLFYETVRRFAILPA